MKKKKISNRQFAEALYEISENQTGKKLTEAIMAFARYVAEARRVKQIPKIIEEYERYAGEMRGEHEIKITTAHGLGSDTEKSVRKVFGAKTKITENKDEKIIGGLIIAVGDKILDASIKTELEQLRRKMKSSTKLK